jgi:hypothetical protein
MKKSLAGTLAIAAVILLPKPKGKHKLLNPDLPNPR